eukprot:jgi/Psemu1/5476/gm1.5476_g
MSKTPSEEYTTNTEQADESKTKKQKLKALTSKEKKEEEDRNKRNIHHWLHLYEKRWNSPVDLEEYNNYPIPPGTWGRIDQSMVLSDNHIRTIAIAIAIKLQSTSETMDIPNNNVDSDADSNISQILVLDDDRKPSARKDPPLGGTSVKKKNLNLGSVLFSHQKYNADFSSSSSSSSDDDSIEIPRNDKAPPTNKAPNKKASPNPRQEAFKGHSLSDLYRNKHSSALIKLQTKAINSGPTVTQRQQNWSTEFIVPILTQTIKYLDQVEKEFDGATNQYIEQMEAVAAKTRQTEEKKAKSVASSKGDRPQDFIEYDITKGDTLPCPKCGHMMVMQLDTTEIIAEYNQKVNSRPKPRRAKYIERRFACYCHKQHCMMADKGGNCVRCQSKYRTGIELFNPGDSKELEEDTAPNTMPGLVPMIHDTIAEATRAKFLEDTTTSKQDITCNACSSVFYQMASDPHHGSANFQKTIKEAIQLRAKHKRKTTGIPGLDAVSLPMTPRRSLSLHQMRHQSKLEQVPCSNQSQSMERLTTTTTKEIQQTPKYVRDVKMEAFDMSCKENTTPETCNVVDLIAENLTNQEDSKVACILKKRVKLSCQQGDDVTDCCNAVVQWGKRKKIADKERDK